MHPHILLLDCSKNIYTRLKQQGYNVDEGSIGFRNGIYKLPCPIYECDIFIYNPKSIKKIGDCCLSKEDVNNKTPEFSSSVLNNHIYRGGIILTFINNIADNLSTLNEVYNWIPKMSNIQSTKDFQPVSYLLKNENKCFSPIIDTTQLKIPIMLGMEFPSDLGLNKNNVPLFGNRNETILSGVIKYGKGHIVILPEYKNNEEIINTFINRVVPKILNLDSNINIISQFLSPQEKKESINFHQAEENINKAEQEMEKARENFCRANREKINVIHADETAVLVINYYDLALQQEDVSLFYLYKIIEVLKNKYGSEDEAKSILKNNKEWNEIKKTANVSYRDIRHAPKPGEKIKEWTQEDIDGCFKAAFRIIGSYLETIFIK